MSEYATRPCLNRRPGVRVQTEHQIQAPKKNQTVVASSNRMI